jgi:hypothetical protein
VKVDTWLDVWLRVGVGVGDARDVVCCHVNRLVTESSRDETDIE